MASRRIPNRSQIPLLWLLVLVWTVIGLASLSEGAHVIPFSGEIGGNVTFPCPVDKGKTVNLFYVQRGNIFVNGYYANRDMPSTWENTRVDRSETAVHMYGLNISHIGAYECYLQYSDDSKPAITKMSLTVTARYSEPTVTRTCVGEHHSRFCVVTCASHGGYPRATMRFEVNPSGNVSRQTWSVVSDDLSEDPDTKMYNSSGTARFNCSFGEVEHIRCSVGEATSVLFSVCKANQPPPPTTNNLAAIAGAVCLVVAVMSVVCVLLWRRHYQHQNRPSGAAGCRANGHAGEVLLNGVTVTNAS